MTSPYREIIIGTDGSPTAERAIRTGAGLALALELPVSIATAWYRDMPDKPVLSERVEMPTGSPGAMEASWADMAVSDGAAIAREVGVSEPRTATPQGHPADALLEEVSRRPEALLVIGTVGLGSASERLLGNIPHQISHHATTDVLLVRTDPDAPKSYKTVGIATDGSETAAVAVQRGMALAEALGAEPVLVTVATNEKKGEQILDRIVADLDGRPVSRRVVVGRKASDSLIEAGEEFDLLVIGNKGMSGPSRLLGSVANSVTHRVPTDLLLVNTVGRRR
jgi:nucleotide-binding universal stress UspA family protein